MAWCWCCFFFSSRRRHTRWPRDWSSDVCSSDLRRSSHLRSGRTPARPATGQLYRIADGVTHPGVLAHLTRGKGGVRAHCDRVPHHGDGQLVSTVGVVGGFTGDRKSTRLNSSHVAISYAV